MLFGWKLTSWPHALFFLRHCYSQLDWVDRCFHWYQENDDDFPVPIFDPARCEIPCDTNSWPAKVSSVRLTAASNRTGDCLDVFFETAMIAEQFAAINTRSVRKTAAALKESFCTPACGILPGNTSTVNAATLSTMSGCPSTSDMLGEQSLAEYLCNNAGLDNVGWRDGACQLIGPTVEADDDDDDDDSK